jgi:hypothetical protein
MQATTPRGHVKPLPAPFLRHRSELAREASVRALEVAVQQTANLVLNAAALADRMEERPARDLEEARRRRASVALLRDAARAGQEAIAHATDHLLTDRLPQTGRRGG